MKRNAFQEIACQQVMAEDASVFSVQWTELPISIAGTLDPQFLAIVHRLCSVFGFTGLPRQRFTGW
jgi:hypothetical protein